MCIFCKIVDGEIPNQTVLENEDFLCFHDINPVAKIHVLIIPKKHYDSFDVIEPELMVKMTNFIHEVAQKLNVREKGYRIITNIKEHGGQEVPHLHFHLLAGEYVGRLVGNKK
ncbi:histidine triad nucleotide-binding protein [Malaciobacter molluscorum LMG 25693]|uniref:Histidine triad nucleotide-binding protein n=1 Tax=Malaciobacter molluscorum LMG 25693 TaxID=870501 RepID=A0A2G1DK97_9BACT|nr:histidine triad nucleotide-binding protein [Malaciobacter molluscorum]AXX91346.1 histidine triad nucleotide-binding protein, Hint/PKCI branch [Malaciobacter molluscorum LMG 25693]PHO18901.1 histidine triad nucleotide-binding protein [Malaciobacter molluscorum LMG 25693]